MIYKIPSIPSIPSIVVYLYGYITVVFIKIVFFRWFTTMDGRYGG